jgi:hypothetical protein
LIAKPIVNRKIYRPFGCGLEEIIEVAYQTNDKQLQLVHVVLTDLVRGHSQRGYVLAINGKVLIGHGMCSGEFTYNKNSKYRANLTFMSFEGHTALHRYKLHYRPPRRTRDAVYSME